MLETVIFTEPIIKPSQLVVKNTKSAGLICGHFWKRPLGSFLVTCNAILLFRDVKLVTEYASSLHFFNVFFGCQTSCKLQEKL